jgi:hypothetical protein
MWVASRLAGCRSTCPNGTVDELTFCTTAHLLLVISKVDALVRRQPIVIYEISVSLSHLQQSSIVVSQLRPCSSGARSLHCILLPLLLPRSTCERRG